MTSNDLCNKSTIIFIFYPRLLLLLSIIYSRMDSIYWWLDHILHLCYEKKGLCAIIFCFWYIVASWSNRKQFCVKVSNKLFKIILLCNFVHKPVAKYYFSHFLLYIFRIKLFYLLCQNLFYFDIKEVKFKTKVWNLLISSIIYKSYIDT